MSHQHNRVSSPLVNKHCRIYRMQIEAYFYHVNCIDIFRHFQWHRITWKQNAKSSQKVLSSIRSQLLRTNSSPPHRLNMLVASFSQLIAKHQLTFPNCCRLVKILWTRFDQDYISSKSPCSEVKQEFPCTFREFITLQLWQIKVSGNGLRKRRQFRPNTVG